MCWQINRHLATRIYIHSCTSSTKGVTMWHFPPRPVTAHASHQNGIVVVDSSTWNYQQFTGNRLVPCDQNCSNLIVISPGFLVDSQAITTKSQNSFMILSNCGYMCQCTCMNDYVTRSRNPNNFGKIKGHSAITNGFLTETAQRWVYTGAIFPDWYNSNGWLNHTKLHYQIDHRWSITVQGRWRWRGLINGPRAVCFHSAANGQWWSWANKKGLPMVVLRMRTRPSATTNHHQSSWTIDKVWFATLCRMDILTKKLFPFEAPAMVVPAMSVTWCVWCKCLTTAARKNGKRFVIGDWVHRSSMEFP